MKIEITNDKILIEGESIGKIIQNLLMETLKTKIKEKNIEKDDFIETKKEVEPTLNNTSISKSPTLNTTADSIFTETGNTYGFKFSEASEDNFEKLDECKQPSNPNRFNTGQVAITMGTIDKPDIDQIADIDKYICGYDRIRVFDSMERKCDITIINDGSDSLYFIINRNGIDHEEEMWSQAEIMIYPGEAWKIYNVYELRIRSETQGNKYRITEDDIIVGSTIRSVT